MKTSIGPWPRRNRCTSTSGTLVRTVRPLGWDVGDDINGADSSELSPVEVGDVVSSISPDRFSLSMVINSIGWRAVEVVGSYLLSFGLDSIRSFSLFFLTKNLRGEMIYMYDK